MDAQEQHDQEMAERGEIKLEPGSKKRLQATLRRRRPSSYTGCNPMTMALANHPGLTEEDKQAAEKAAREAHFRRWLERHPPVK